MQNTILETVYTLPLAYLDNGATASPWINPNYLLLQDTLTAESNSSQSAVADVIVANFPFNIPVGAVITGIQFKVRGYVGAITVPPASLSFFGVNTLPTTPEYYPYIAPFTGFTQGMADYTFGGTSYLFNRAWTVDEINNFKLQLVAAGDVFIDDVQVQIFYYIPAASSPVVPPSSFCLTCESPLQGVEYFLARAMNGTDTKAYVYNFNFADGTPIQMSDLGACGGVIDVVLDEGETAENGNNFMENAQIIGITRIPNGPTDLVELDFGNITNRGLGFKTPYTHVIGLVSPHSVNAKLIISNNAPFESKHLRSCQAGVVFSRPIHVQYNGVDVVFPAEKFNFTGGGVNVIVDPFDPTKAIINIPGNSTIPPVVVGTGSGTSGTTQVTSLTFPLTTSGVNRGVLVQISTEQLATVSSVTFNGVALTQVVASTNVPANLRQEEWFLVAPFLGTANVVITLSTAAYISAGAEAIVGVDQATPIGATQTATAVSLAPSLVLITTRDNSLVFDGLATAQTPILYTVGPGQVVNWAIFAATSTRQGASSYEPSGTFPDNVTMSWTITQNTRWLLTAVEILGITPPSSGDELVKVSGADTTAGFLQPKLNIHSSDLSVTVTETITNPGANEILDVDITGAGGGGTTPFSINQVAHGFAVGDIIRPTTAQWTLSVGTSSGPTDLSSEKWAQVTVVTDANNFVALPLDGIRQQAVGIVALVAGFAGGDPVFVDPTTPGAITNVDPTAVGTVSAPIGYVEADAVGTPISLLTTNYRNYLNAAPSPSGGNMVVMNGITTKDTADASVVQLISHGLGSLPSKATLTFLARTGATSNTIYNAVLTYNGTTASVVGLAFINGQLRDMAATDITLFGSNTGNETEFQTGVITWDATNIIITWTKTNAPTGVVNILWEAETGGGSSLYTVNADETISSWFTTPILAPFTGSAGTESPWTVSGTWTQSANGSSCTSTIAMSAFAPLTNLLGGVAFGPLTFDPTTSLRMKWAAILPIGFDVSGGGAYRSAFNGFSENGTTDSGDITDTGIRRVGFGTYDGDLYAIACDNVAITATNLGAYASPISQLYEIILNGTTSALFYINGVLVATISTDLPTTASILIQTVMANSAGTSETLVQSHFTLSQEL